MKKVINLKEIMIVLVAVMLITISTSVFALNLDNVVENNTTTIPANEYQNAQTVPEENTNTNTNINTNVNTNINTNTNVNTNTNSVKTYNTNNTTDLPQTGIEDYNIGILLIICVASAIYAYKKVGDYRNI